jgi:hypothetical protein
MQAPLCGLYTQSALHTAAFVPNRAPSYKKPYVDGPEVYGEYNYGYDSYKAPNGYKDGYKPNSPEYDYNGYKTTTPPTHKDKYGYKAPATPGYER